MIQFFIEGQPCGQPRPRFARGRAYLPKTSKRKDGTRVPLPIWGWKEAIEKAAKTVLPKRPFAGPLWVGITLYFARPDSHKRLGKFHAPGDIYVFKKIDVVDYILRQDAPTFHTSRPDRDNCDKPILDVLTDIGFWQDDAQVVDGFVRKYYSFGKVGAFVQIARPKPPDAGLVRMEV